MAAAKPVDPEIARIREQARQVRAINKARSQQRLAESQQITAQQAQRIAQEQQSREQWQQRQDQRKFRSNVTSAAGSAGSSAFHAATLSPNSSLPLTIIMMMVMLSLFYYVVTRADQFSGFVGFIGDFLHKVSSTTPLFAASQTSSK